MPRPLHILLAAAVVGLAAASASASDAVGPRPGTGCGGTLWRLMTLSDPFSGSVTLDRQATTIADIAKLQRPQSIVAKRTTRFQRQVWSLRAVVDRYRIASNGEIVLILYSIETGQFMDAYLPAQQCLGAKARARGAMLDARTQLTSRCQKVTAAWQLVGITVDIAGVGFWNPDTATRGALPNGAELRPVTSLKVVAGCGVG